MNDVEAVLFDFDGTLIDSADIISHCFNGALEGRGYPAAESHRIRSMIGRPLREMFAAFVAEATEGEVEMLVVAYRSVFRKIDVSLVQLLPGVEAVVGRLSERFKVAVVTSRTASGTIRILKQHQLQSHFETIVGIEHVRHGKPDPEPVRLALARLGVEPERALMVGDTVHDIEAAAGAGVAAVGVTTGPHTGQQLLEAGALHVIDGLGELEAILATGQPL